MNKDPLYKKIYNKMKFLSKKLYLNLNIEHSIKINNNSFNKSRYVFLLSNYNYENYNNNNNIIKNNISYIKKQLSLSRIPKFNNGFIIEFIYAIDIQEKISKIYITVLQDNNKTVIFSNIHKNHNFNKYITRYYIYKNNFYKKYPNFSLVKFLKKYGEETEMINHYYLIYQNNNFRAISFRTSLFNNDNLKKFILNLFTIFNLNLYNQNIINFLNKYKLYILTNITINNKLDEINLYFST